MKVPVLVHRWFANGGAGWSCHPDLHAHILGCQAALTGHLNGDLGPVEPIEVMGAARALVGLRMPDPDRETDERNRRVNVLCAAVLPGRPVGDAADEIRELLKTIPLPTQQGMSPQLELDWSGSLTPLAQLPSAVKAPIPVIKTQSPYRFALIGVSTMAFLIVLVVFFFVGRSKPPTPEFTKTATPSPNKPAEKIDPDVKLKPDSAAVLIEMKAEINKARETERLTAFLKNNVQAIRDLETTDKVKICDEFINQCRELKRRHGFRPMDDEYLKSASRVDAAVDDARKRIDVLKKAMDVFEADKELRKYENEEWEYIEDALYGRVQWCWRSLEKEFRIGEEKTKSLRELVKQFKAKEWHKARKDFVESYNGYSADRKYDNAKRELINKMNAWVVHLQQPNDYVFEITLPDAGTWDIIKSDEWTDDWSLAKNSGKFYLTGNKIVAASKPTPIMVFPVWLKVNKQYNLLFWKIGDNQTEIAGFEGASAKEKVVVVLRNSKTAVWPIITKAIKAP